MSRSEPGLYDFIARDWFGDAEVAVIFDRRLTSRREAAVAHAPERRRAERRVLPEVDQALAEVGWAEVEVD